MIKISSAAKSLSENRVYDGISDPVCQKNESIDSMAHSHASVFVVTEETRRFLQNFFPCQPRPALQRLWSTCSQALLPSHLPCTTGRQRRQRKTRKTGDKQGGDGLPMALPGRLVVD